MERVNGKIQLIIVVLLSMTGYDGVSEKEQGAGPGQQHRYAAAQLGEEQAMADSLLKAGRKLSLSGQPV